MNTPPSLPPLLVQQTPPQIAHTLPLEQAWAVALQWRDLLRNKVLLERAPDDSVGLTKSYAWIRMLTHQRYEVSAARAAAVAWFGLSCCPGYGGDENPVFWRCVFSKLTRRNIQTVQSITDAYGFFDDDGMDFPRFKLEAGVVDTHVLLFCGDPGEELEGEDKAKLAHVMDVLAPWMNQARTLRRPVVSLAEAYSTNFFLEQFQEEAKQTEPWPSVAKLSRFIADSNRNGGSGWPSPMFVVKELEFGGIISIVDVSILPRLYEIVRSHEADIVEYSYSGRREVSRDAHATNVQYMLCLPGSGAHARTRKICIDDTGSGESSLPALASALPMSTSIWSLSIDNHQFVDTIQTAITWIAYALFHPDTPATPWKSLTLKNSKLGERGVDVLRAMARGNNLVAMLKGREPTSDGYYRARLASGAIVYDQQDASSSILITSEDGELEVEVSDVSNDDKTQWGEWVAVVVPAYGLGWVQSVNVTSVVKRAPAKSSLTQLIISASIYRSAFEMVNNLAQVLPLIGKRLVHLDMCQYGDFASTAHLIHALSWCPMLESLVVKHQADGWDCDAVAKVLPRLRELEVRLNGYDGEDVHLSIFDVPPSVQVLRINVVDGQGVYSRSLEAVRHILTQPSQLRVFHWEDGLDGSSDAITYAASCADTTHRIEALGIPLNDVESVGVRLPAACTAAFLSVISHQEQSRPLAKLSVELAKIIVAFAGSKLKRRIVLEPDGSEVPRVRHRRQVGSGPWAVERRLLQTSWMKGVS